MDSLLRGGSKAVKEIDLSVKALLERTVRLRLLGLVLESPRPGWKQEVSALMEKCDWAELEQAAGQALDGWTEGRYLALFGPGGTISPRAAASAEGRDPGRVLADLSAFYEAFAFRPGSGNPPDHIAVEADFLGYLTFKEAYAIASGNEEAARTVRDGAAAFCRLHVGPHARALAKNLERAAGAGPLPAAAAALLDLVTAQVAQAGDRTPEDRSVSTS